MKKLIQKIRYKLRVISRIPYSTYLCIKYPFLYPRNRFTDLHYTNWNFRDEIKEIHNKAYINLVVKQQGEFNKIKNDKVISINKNEEITYIESPFLVYYGHNITASHINNTILIYVDDYIVKRIPINNYFKSGIITDISFGIKTVEITNFFKEKSTNRTYFLIISGENLIKQDNSSIKNYFEGSYLKIQVSKYYLLIVKFLQFIEKYPLQWIFCLPTYTELDSMPRGWRKAFGLQMCEEIKQELKKHNYLYKYRIMQIKEKFGSLRLYDSGSPDGCIYPIINKYESLSTKTCINCGKPAKYMTTGWISPYCEKCVPKNEYYNEI